jgi:rubredoxin-NAD+ reductase
MMGQASIVIVGSGLAGYTVAREFRKLNADSPVTILSSDHGGFYSKPMLSNALATGKTPDSILNSDAAKMADQLKLTVRPHTRVMAIDRSSSSLVLQDGERLPYRQLVLALGADQIRLPLSGDGAGLVSSVNDLDDYRHLRDALEGKNEVVILGAGLIGCEFANDLAVAGYRVHLVDIGEWPLGRLLPQSGGAFLQSRLESVGVTFHLNDSVQHVDRVGERLRLTLAKGGTLEADIVLSAVGLKPRITLAQEAGIAVNRGIVVDQSLKTQDPSIYALGDCAEVAGRVLPFVMPIMHASRALAATLAGNPTPASYPAMPVLVKTPSCPTTISPPDIGARGDWKVTEDQDGFKALFQDEGGNLLGYALMGAATKEKNALTSQLPPVMG